MKKEDSLLKHLQHFTPQLLRIASAVSLAMQGLDVVVKDDGVYVGGKKVDNVTAEALRVLNDFDREYHEMALKIR